MSTLGWVVLFIVGLLAGWWLVIKGAEESGPSAASVLVVFMPLWAVFYSLFWLLIWFGASS